MNKKSIIILAVSVLAIAFTANTIATVVSAQRGDIDSTNNPIANLLLQRFSPNPNLLVEDHVKISCEPEFSVKVFTASVLKNANFKVTDESGSVVFGTAFVQTINPLWHKVWFRGLSPFPLPNKILVTMVATANNREEVRHTLIVEPDCDRPAGDTTNIVNNITVIHPLGKILVNPEPLDPERIRIPLPPLVMVVPKDMLEGPLNVQVRTPGGIVVGQGHLDTIDTEIVSMELTGGGVIIPVLPNPPGGQWSVDSFFDVFFEIQIGDNPPITHPVRIINAIPLEQALFSGHDFNSVSDGQ